jgi:hypothetical protein
MKDYYPKLFTAPLGIDSKYFHRAFANPFTMKNVKEKPPLELCA